jgi:nucleotide-binding universal stress UspA family protein
MKKILCPTDYSTVARNAANFAANIAKIIDAEITLFHVQSKFDEASEQYVKSRGGLIDTATDYLVDVAEQISRTYGVVCKTDVETLSMPLKKAIAERATGYDLIVMGTNGPHDVVQYFTGSNSYNAAVNSEVPVVIVPPGVEYKPVKNILFAIDYVSQPKVPMAQLLPFATSNGSQITLLQVLENAPDAAMKKRLDDIQYTIKGEFENAVRLRFSHISGENIAESIDEYTRNHKADLLALCTVERNGLSDLFHDSVIKKISAEAEYPLFVFNH